MKSILKLFFISLLACILVGFPQNADARDPIMPQDVDWPLRDVAMDSDGNLYIIARHWANNRPYLKTFDSKGEERPKFKLVLPNFCCEPFPLKFTISEDGFLYILLPGKEGLVSGAELLLVRIDSSGEQDEDFGDQGVLKFPPGFSLRDFDVSPEGVIWVLNRQFELFKFDDTGWLIKIRELSNIFPEKIMGGYFENFQADNLFAMNGNRLLLTGEIRVSGNELYNDRFFSVMELSEDGVMVNHLELSEPWFQKNSEPGSFFKPLQGKSFIREDGVYGSILGFKEGIKGEPDLRALMLLDWSLDEKFGFYNLQPLELPKEVFLGYDLNKVFFVRDKKTIKLFYPFPDRHDLLVVDYDDKGKIKDKFTLKAFQ